MEEDVAAAHWIKENNFGGCPNTQHATPPLGGCPMRHLCLLDLHLHLLQGHPVIVQLPGVSVELQGTQLVAWAPAHAQAQPISNVLQQLASISARFHFCNILYDLVQLFKIHLYTQ